MCDSDLTKWELDAISAVEQTYEESANFAQVDSEGCRLRLESRFKEVALAITQLYTSYSHALGSPQHRQDAYNAFRTAACKLTDFYNESKGTTALIIRHKNIFFTGVGPVGHRSNWTIFWESV